MKVSVGYKNKIQANFMMVGQCGTLADNSAYAGDVVLKVYDRLVSLSNPVQTWPGSFIGLVEVLPPKTSITLRTEV